MLFFLFFLQYFFFYIIFTNTNLFGPTGKTLSIPLQIFLVIWRHMALICAILVRAAMQSRMRGNSVAAEEDFYCAGCQPHIYLLTNILISNRVVLLFYGNVVILLDGGNFPDSYLKRRVG